ncbi:MAG TPA: IS481 family transposase [Candidatus Nanoarchaeia archaeon]|nr:IS481 family transposase [Candidatus Nanoarchaeia archaeon]
MFGEAGEYVFSHKNFLSGVRPEWMVKLKNKKRLEWCLKRYANGGASQKDLAKMLDVTPRRFRQLYMYYTTRNSLPRIGQSLGRPKKLLDPLSKQLITETHGKYCLNAVYLEKVIFAENNIRLPHNTIHAVLKQEGLAKSEPNKQKRRKAYIRYEREHSLSAVHSDWHEPSGGPKVCAIEDDSSRKILSGGEFDEATTENTIHLMEEAIGKTQHLGKIRECITDHGTQYFANKRDKEGNAEHAFEAFLKGHNIKPILCRYKHPQSNGKIERWWGIYKTHRKRFNTFQEFIAWYNNRPHGSLNLRRAETPEQAFWRRLPEEYYYALAAKFLR